MWNLDINGGTLYNFNGTATLYDLDVFLYDVSNPENWLPVESSTSNAENSEPLWITLEIGHDYARFRSNPIRVRSPLSGTTPWPGGWLCPTILTAMVMWMGRIWLIFVTSGAAVIRSCRTLPQFSALISA